MCTPAVPACLQWAVQPACVHRQFRQGGHIGHNTVIFLYSLIINKFLPNGVQFADIYKVVCSGVKFNKLYTVWWYLPNGVQFGDIYQIVAV